MMAVGIAMGVLGLVGVSVFGADHRAAETVSALVLLTGLALVAASVVVFTWRVMP